VRIVFFGTPPPAVPTLLALIDAGHDVPLVVTQPDRPVGRSRTPVPTPVKVAAAERGIPVIQPLKVRGASFRETLAAQDPELLVVVAYGRILTRRVLDLPRRGAVNAHFSMLPLLRGAAPVQWALAHGFARTGVTTMLMNEKLDEGDLLLQQEVEILEGEHTPALQARLAEDGARLVVETLARMEAGSVMPEPQSHADATFAPILSRSTGEVGPELTAREIDGRIRGFDPWPGVWMSAGGRRLRLLEARVLEGEAATEKPGRLVASEDGGLILTCGRSTRLLLLRIQPEGRRAMAVGDAVRGRYLHPGDHLEAPTTPG